MARILVLAVAVIACVLLSLFASAAATWGAAEPGAVTWSVRPAGAQGADGRAWIEVTLDPGSIVEEHMEIRNLGSTDAEFHLEAADGYFTEAGRFNMLARGEESSDAGTWIGLASSITVPAGGAVVVPFTIRVPDDATPGDHPAGVAAGISSQGRDTDGDAVAVDSRVGFRVMVRVTGELDPKVAIQTAFEYQANWNPFQPGRALVEYSVRNAGNTRLSLSPTLTVAHPLGATDQKDGELIADIAPGETRTGRIIVEGVWPTLIADVTLRVQGETVPESAATLPGASQHVTLTAIPWGQLGLGALLLVLIYFLIRRRRRARRRLDSMLAAAREEGRRSAAGVSS